MSQIIRMLIFFQPTTFNIAVLYIFFLHPHIIHCLLTKVWSQNQVDPIHDLRIFSCTLERIKLDTTLNSLQYLVYYASHNQCCPVLGFDKNLKFGFLLFHFFLRNLQCSSAKPNNSCIRNWPERQTSTLNQLVAACNLSHLQESWPSLWQGLRFTNNLVYSFQAFSLGTQLQLEVTIDNLCAGTDAQLTICRKFDQIYVRQTLRICWSPWQHIVAKFL